MVAALSIMSSAHVRVIVSHQVFSLGVRVSALGFKLTYHALTDAFGTEFFRFTRSTILVNPSNSGPFLFVCSFL